MKCNIIIPVWNEFELTRDCINSVIKNTIYPYSLIIIDNASDVQTRKYLEGLKENKSLELTLIRNEKNVGFVKAVNQGIGKADAPYICLLNNDTQVAPGWLTEMIKVAESRENIGIVNPNSNTLGWKAKRGQTPEVIANELKCYAGDWSQLGWATGFCMLIKSKIIAEVGIFDEIYGMGTFEDADFSKRAQKLGYISVCAKGAYVRHHERRSFVKFKKFDQHFKRNQQIFYRKWGRIQRILYILTKNNLASIEDTNAASLKLAQEGNMVWIFLKGQDREQSNNHSNIYTYRLPSRFFNLVSLWRILKRKKRFDKIYVNDNNYAKMLNRFKIIHKAEVVNV